MNEKTITYDGNTLRIWFNGVTGEVYIIEQKRAFDGAHIGLQYRYDNIKSKQTYTFLII